MCNDGNRPAVYSVIHIQSNYIVIKYNYNKLHSNKLNNEVKEKNKLLNDL